MMFGQGTFAGAAAVAMITMAGAVQAQSPVQLEIAAQRSLSDLHTVVLVYSDELAASAAVPGNFALVPARTITAAALDDDAANLVRLQLDPSTPLVPGTTYQIQTTGGNDADSQPLDPALTAQTFVARSLESEIANILECQIPDGAFSTNSIGAPGWQNGEPLRLVPYYGCIAAQGLIYGYRLTRDASLLDSVRDYLEWHADRIPASNFITDYVGYYPTYQSTGTYDSTDSYGALFAWTLWMYYQETRDDAFLSQMYPALEKSVDAMEATLQSDNLTWATPDYKVKYTMDNAEVFQGYFAAAQLARAAGDGANQSQWNSRAAAVRSAVHENLYLDDLGRYSYAKSNAGGVFTDWDVYYPDAMANEFALYYVHQPTDAWFATAWASEKQKFFLGHVPDEDMSSMGALAAARAKDELFLDLSFARTLQNHGAWNYAHESAKLIAVEAERLAGTVDVPPVASGAITVDGNLSESAWDHAARLTFHKNGVMNGFANEDTYEYPQNTIDPDRSWTVTWLYSGHTLYVGIEADDRYITSADVATDSDGLSHLYIRNAANDAVLHQATYTFFPNAGAATVPTAPAGTILANPAVGTAAFAFKSGNNSPNDASDTDTGYTMEIAIDLSHPDAGGYAGMVGEVTVGLRLADMDGTPGEGWPWSNGAFGTMMQWARGLAANDYTVNTLRFLPPDNASSVQDWSVY